MQFGEMKITLDVLLWNAFMDTTINSLHPKFSKEQCTIKKSVEFTRRNGTAVTKPFSPKQVGEGYRWYKSFK